MFHLDLTLPTLEANLALDEALLLQAEEGGPEVLRFWEWPRPAVVLGAASRLAEEVDQETCRADGVPIGRRSSGGGTVLLGPGCLIHTLVLAYARALELTQIASTYRFILGRTAVALGLQESQPAGTSDLAQLGRKVSGNAQQRKRHHLLQHGTLLYQFDRFLTERYLYMPRRQPDYRQQRSHAEFLDNLPVSAEELKARLRQCWQAEEKLSSWPRDLVHRLLQEKYSQAEWVRRR